MICKLHRSGASFRGAVAYCLDDARDRDRDREADGPDEPTTGERSRVAWTETVNLATDDARVAARQMAATVTYANELKALAGVRAGGRRLEKPVTHYSLSWGPGEKPPEATMVNAARASLRALGLEDHQAVLVAHRDGTTPHVHVVANRVSTEDGRAAPLSQSRLQLSRWAESYERKQGRIQCPRRVEHNRDRRLVGPQYDPYRTASMYGGHTGDAHYRRTQCGRIARVPFADGRSGLEMAGVAVRRVDEQRKWQTVRARRDDARAPLDEKQRGEWVALYSRQEDERDRLDWDTRSLRGRVERWRTSGGFWSELGGVIRGKAYVLDKWRHDLERDQREDRAALGREHSAQALEVDRRAQHAYERTMNEPVMMREKDLAAIAQELKSQGLQPGPDADRALASIASGALQRQLGLTPERTHGRDYDRTDDFGPSR